MRLHIDTERRVARLDGKPIHLTRAEYKLLVKMYEDPERLWTREELTRHQWDWPEGVELPSSRMVDTVACRLRAKLGREFVINEWGEGYRLVQPSFVDPEELEEAA